MDASRREALFVLGGGAAVTTFHGVAEGAVIQSGTASPSVQTEVRSWLRSEAQIFGPDPAPHDLAPLAQYLASAAVVGIGEATHGTHEDQAFKSALVRSLIENGKVRVLALECNHRPGLRLDRYVASGEGDPLDVLRADDFFQNWKTEELIGCISWIRAWNVAGHAPVRIVGVDCQAVGADTLRALQWLRSTDRVATASLEKDLAPLVSDERLREGRMFELIQSLDQVQFRAAMSATQKLEGMLRSRVRSGDMAASEAAHAAKAAHQGMLMSVPMTKFASKSEQNDPALYARRDEYMADNLLSLSEGAPTAYWAHNMHVLPWDFGKANAPTTTGGYLKRRIGNSYQNVVFDFDGGHVHAKLYRADGRPPGRAEPWRVFERPSFSDTGARLLAAMGIDNFWIRVSDGKAPATFVREQFKRDWPGFGLPERPVLLDHNRVSLEGADVLVFFRRMTPSRFLPFVQRV